MLAQALAGSFAALAAWGSAQAAGTLTVCSESSPDGFDVVQYELSVTIDAAGIALYDQLTSFAPGTTRIVPVSGRRGWRLEVFAPAVFVDYSGEFTIARA